MKLLPLFVPLFSFNFVVADSYIQFPSLPIFLYTYNIRIAFESAFVDASLPNTITTTRSSRSIIYEAAVAISKA